MSATVNRLKDHAKEVIDRAWKTALQVLVLGAITALSSQEVQDWIGDNPWAAVVVPVLGAALSVISSALSTAIGDRSPTVGHVSA